MTSFGALRPLVEQLHTETQAPPELCGIAMLRAVNAYTPASLLVTAKSVADRCDDFMRQYSPTLCAAVIERAEALMREHLAKKHA
jgi:hypothetical protein